ncbi:MAG: DNA repair protein RecN [Mariniphaga sp.]|nr:DNA repair protein RecN [Mariniphaga sp.]
MLNRLTISNYALITNLEVDFHPGLNSVTGETGAGKSIILGALSLILGNRADLSVLKNQQEKCIVEGVFEIEHYNLHPLFIENDLDYNDSTILRREINPTGKSRAFINDTPVNLKTLREMGLKLIDIHSQHQNLELINHTFQLELVDTVAGTSQYLLEYSELYNRFVALKKKLNELAEKSTKEKADLDYWQFQYDQLHDAKLNENEQEELETELEKLTHAEEIKSVCTEVQHLLDDEQFSMIQNLKESSKKLESISSYLSPAKALSRRVQSCLLELKDTIDELKKLADIIEYNPVRIEQVNDRLHLIYSLQQKHRVATIKELIGLKQSFGEKINQVTGYDQETQACKNELTALLSKLDHKARELSQARKNSFQFIEETVMKDLQQLGMPKSKFKVEHQYLADFSPSGKDTVSFLFSANVDIPPAEISKIASGGEMSRLMLAVKNLLRTSRALPTVVFDEIDSGVSGEIALKMGNILKEFSTSTQIINITHLPQIAAKGNAHFKVYKYEQDEKTFTGIKQLNEKERVEELAKMVGGEKITDTTIKTAQELLNN